MDWNVGDRVRSIPKLAHLYDGTVWKDKLSKPRGGTVIEVPLAIHTSEDGHGTLLIDWEILTGEKGDKSLWQRWMYSKHIEKVDAL